MAKSKNNFYVSLSWSWSFIFNLASDAFLSNTHFEDSRYAHILLIQWLLQNIDSQTLAENFLKILTSLG